MDLGEVGWGDVDWIGLAKDRNRWRAVVNAVRKLSITCGISNSAQLYRVSLKEASGSMNNKAQASGMSSAWLPANSPDI
jgi:hypothetical protein